MTKLRTVNLVWDSWMIYLVWMQAIVALEKLGNVYQPPAILPGLSWAWDVRAATATSTVMAPTLTAPAADVQHKLPIAASSS